MEDWILLLMLAFFGIIGYVVMDRIDRAIDRYITDDDESEQEKKTDEPSEDRKPKRTYSGMSLFLHF